MSDFKSIFQDEVRRLAKKEVKALNETLTTQAKTIKALTKRIADLEKKTGATASAVKKDEPKDALIPAKKGKARFSPKTLLKFRKKYGLSQKGIAAILGIATITVSHWESGKNRPRPNQVEAISSLSKLGKRKVEALLAEKAPEEFAAKKKATSQKKAVKAAKPAKVAKPAKKAKAPKATKTVAVPAPAVASEKTISVNPAKTV